MVLPLWCCWMVDRRRASLLVHFVAVAILLGVDGWMPSSSWVRHVSHTQRRRLYTHDGHQQCLQQQEVIMLKGPSRPLVQLWGAAQAGGAKARIELEGEVSLEEMKEFWAARGLKPHRSRWLLKEAENQGQLRCPERLERTLGRLGEVFEGVDVAKLCSRFPGLLLVEPRVVQERVEAIQKMVDRVPARVLALRAAELLLIEPEVVKNRLDALQRSLPQVDAKKLCSKALGILVEQDQAALVAQSLSGITQELRGIDSPVQVLIANPLLLTKPVAATIREKKALLEPYLHDDEGAAATRLLASAPYLITYPPEQLSSALAELSALLPSSQDLLPVITSSPRLLTLDPKALGFSLRGVCDALPGLNLTHVAIKEPSLLPRLATGADMVERVREWQEEFSPVDIPTLFTKHPSLLALDTKAALEKLDALEEAIMEDEDVDTGDDEEDEDEEDQDQEDDREHPIELHKELDRLAILRKAPMILKEEVATLVKRAWLLREVLGPRDCMLLARSFPRLFLKDFYKNLVPKAQFFARVFPPQTFSSLLRDSPQIFFYSTTSIEGKVVKLDKALSHRGFNVTALVTAFPAIVCMDANKNVKLKVESLCSCYPGQEMVGLIERQPRVLIHGFGRISRVVYAAKAGLSAEEALKMVTLSWVELREYPAYLQGELGKQELASLTVMEASRGAALREAIAKGMDREALLSWEPPVDGVAYEGGLDDGDDEDDDGDEEEHSPRRSSSGKNGGTDRPPKSFVIPLSRG